MDAVTDVIAGILVDNTHTKLGKGRPYELSIVGMTLCTILLFSCNPKWSTVVKCVWLFCTYTFTFSIFTTLRAAGNTPYTIRHFSNNSVLIQKVSSYGGIITMAGSMILSVAFPTLMARFATSAAGWTRLIAAIMVPATVIGVLRFFLCKEDPNVDASTKQEPIRFNEILTLFKTNKYVWYFAVIMLCYNIITNLAMGTYYFKWVVGDVSVMSIFSMLSMVTLPVMLLYPWLMKKIGSMSKMIFYFCLVGIAGYLAVFLGGGKSMAILMIGYIIGNASTMPLAYYGVLFIMNICTYNEMNGLPRMDGSSGILSNFATKAGGALGAWIGGVLLSLAGYVSAEGVTSQPASAIMMIRVAFAVVPAILIAVIAVCCLAFSKLEPMAAEFEAKKKAEEAKA